MRGVAARIDVQATGRRYRPAQQDEDAPVLVLPVDATPSDGRHKLAASSKAVFESFANEKESEDALRTNSDVFTAKSKPRQIVSVGAPSDKQKSRAKRSRKSPAHRSELTSTKTSLLSFEGGDGA